MSRPITSPLVTSHLRLPPQVYVVTHHIELLSSYVVTYCYIHMSACVMMGHTAKPSHHNTQQLLYCSRMVDLKEGLEKVRCFLFVKAKVLLRKRDKLSVWPLLHHYYLNGLEVTVVVATVSLLQMLPCSSQCGECQPC